MESGDTLPFFGLKQHCGPGILTGILISVNGNLLALTIN